MITFVPFTMNEYVRPACLPETGYEVRGGGKCIISGWGKTESGKLIENELGIYFPFFLFIHRTLHSCKIYTVKK